MEHTQENPTQILNAILGELRRQRVADDLWSADDIADYLGLAKNTVQGRTVKTNGFPRPVMLPTGGKRWVAKEVRAWAMRQR